MGPGPPDKSHLKASSTMPQQSNLTKKDKEKKLGHRRVTGGQVTYKKKATSEIQQAIKLGIQVSVSMTEQKPKRDVLLCDFGIVETVNFPREGSKTTPAHSLSDFKFKTYAPSAFRYFREFFKVDMTDFLDSLCNHELRELSNPGASGSIFYISYDDEFIVKTVQHKEAEFLRELLPEYFMNLMQHPMTLLPKFYGVYCYQCSGKNIRFVVMNNLLPSSIKMHEMYDLKGSTYKRVASAKERQKATPTQKDLDFKEIHPSGILLEVETYEAFAKTIDRDCRVLESFRIMDYSLLLGVHNLDHAKREREEEIRKKLGNVVATPPSSPQKTESQSPEHPSKELMESDYPDVVAASGCDSTTQTSALSRGSSKGKSVRRIAAYSTAMESIQASSEPVELETDEKDQIPPGGIPARNLKGERLFCFAGIIDILQSFRLFKKMEHGLKALVIDGESISVTNPSFYANRFQRFLGHDVFQKVPTLDPPEFSSGSVRFRRIVQLAMKQAPVRKKLKNRNSTREGADGDKDDLPSSPKASTSKEVTDQISADVTIDTKHSHSDSPSPKLDSS